ncbi:MAG: SNF2-related protein [Caldilineaceae bacterium]
MKQDRFEWLEIPEEPKASVRRPRAEVEAVIGKRCPQCGWLDEETATVCFQCGYRYNLDHDMAGRFEQLGVTLHPRLIEGSQSFEAFFRTHGRTREPEATGFYKLRLLAETIRLSRGFDRLLALEELDVEHYQHQIDTALKALNQMRGRALLADEVGLGKTIEAGIIMKELIQRGLVRTVLVLTPASLTEQWREELQNKFHEEFTTVSRAREWKEFGTKEDGRWIASLDRAKRQDHSDGILSREYDLLIVDEAHKLKNRSTLAWKFVNQIRKRYVLMLTATPVQNDLMELYSLITILAPGQLGTVRGFRQHFLQQADARRPKNAPSLRRLLNDIMIRNRRSKVEVAFPRRRAAIYHLSLSEPEWRLYADVTDYIRRRFRSVDSDKHLRLTLMTLQRELSSSPQAVASTLRKMVQDGAYEERARAELLGFLAQAESISKGRKLQAVKEILDGYPGKFLIFTEYRATLEVILKALNEWGISAVGFHGGLNIQQKEAAVATFRGDHEFSGEDPSTMDGDEPGVRVMVSTESGAEGRNLQFCHQLINYDLPWNPMRVEQRIGRLHRLGQEHDVTIFNLSCDETIEAHVIDLLARKIRMFELVIGELDMILGNIEGSKSFEDLIRQAWEASRNEGDLSDRFEEIGSILVRARRDYDRVRESNELLDEYLGNV